ncbi:DUF481 domain-containing protein [Zymobacter palmae]|nr:DUF481 domain-containing protein [Zymobacter palmae]
MAFLNLRHTLLFSVGLLAAAHSFSAMADVTDFEALDDPSTAKKPFDGKAQLGYTGHSGNTDSKTLNAGAYATWFRKDHSYSIWANANSASSDDETTAERYQLGGRTRYNLTNRNYLFGQLRWTSDRFAGYHSRTVLAGGYGRQILVGPPHSLSVEAGPGIRHDDLTSGGSDTRLIAYGALNYAYHISDTANFTQRIGLQYAGNNTTTDSESALNVSINKDFTLRLAYAIEHNSNPPADTTHKTDSTTTVSLIYGF